MPRQDFLSFVFFWLLGEHLRMLHTLPDSLSSDLVSTSLQLALVLNFLLVGNLHFQIRWIDDPLVTESAHTYCIC